MDASHASLRDDFEVSSDELNAMVACAQGEASCCGARMTGAGFGGCTVNLVRQEIIDSFREQVVETYRSRTSLPAEMYVCEVVDGLRIIAGANAPASHSPQD